MPDSIHNANSQQIQDGPVVAVQAVDELLSVQRWDEIRSGISAGEWQKFREFPLVAIGRLSRGEEFRILGGFGEGPDDGLAELALSFPATAIYTIAWNKQYEKEPSPAAR